MGFADNALDRRNRCLKREAIRSRDIELPPEVCDRETLINQESIPEIPVLRIQTPLNGAAHECERLIASPVHDLQEYSSTCLFFRTE